MNPLELYNFIKEVFRWDPDRVAAFATGAILALLLAWVVRRWLFPRRGDRWLMARLRKNIDTLEKERDAAVRSEEQGKRERMELQLTNARFDKDLHLSKADNLNLREKVSTLSSTRDRLKTHYEEQVKNNENLEKLLRAKHEELGQAKGAIERFEKQVYDHEATARQQRVKIEALSEQCEELKEKLSDLDLEKQRVEARLQEGTDDLVQAKEQVNNLQVQIDNFTHQIDLVAKSDGRLWERRAIAVPSPRSPGTPRAPIVAVVNLKGGVGKTTLTANLGATLWKQGKRVLLIDLDYQASLSMLCLSPDVFKQVRVGRRFVQQLLLPGWPGPTGINNLLMPIGSDLGFLLAADEDLQDVEMQAQARWLVKPGEVDVRFLLKQTLHAPEIQNEFDLILLDCPPRLTTACVNALACSDYALIPVQLDQTSADAVPRMLQWLRRLQPTLCPDLSVLGVVANRVSLRNESLTKGQQTIWNELPKRCEDVWGEAVHFFKARIKQDSAFAEAADKHRFAAFDRDLIPYFLDLAAEVRRRVDTHERSRVAAVSEKPQPTSQHVGRK